MSGPGGVLVVMGIDRAGVRISESGILDMDPTNKAAASTRAFEEVEEVEDGVSGPDGVAIEDGVWKQVGATAQVEVLEKVVLAAAEADVLEQGAATAAE